MSSFSGMKTTGQHCGSRSSGRTDTKNQYNQYSPSQKAKNHEHFFYNSSTGQSGWHGSNPCTKDTHVKPLHRYK